MADSVSERRRGTRRSQPVLRVTPRDLDLLAFTASQRLITAGHAQALLGVSAGLTRLRALVRAGLIEREPVHVDGRAPVFRITTTGCRAAGASLARPRPSLGAVEHDLGVAWLHLAGLSGRFGPLQDIVTEREMRSHDARPDRDGPAYGIRIAGAGAAAIAGAGARAGAGTGATERERLHYPDLLLRTTTGHTVAIELELSGKPRARREGILAAYGAEPRIDAVVYLSDKPSIQRAVQASARRLGIAPLIHVQRCAWGVGARVPGTSHAPERTPSPTPMQTRTPRMRAAAPTRARELTP